MKLNRKSVTLGLAGLAVVGALVGGTGIAVAATGTPTVPSTVSSADPAYGHMGGMDHMGAMNGMGDMAGMAFGENSPMAAAAGYLGLSPTDLQTQLHDGQSLADVATAQGKSASGLQDAMIAAMTANLDANTTLTAQEKAADLALMKSHLDEMMTAAHSPTAGFGTAGFGPMGAGMGGMMGR